MFLMGVGPLARWKEAALPELARAAAAGRAGSARRRDAARRLARRAASASSAALGPAAGVLDRRLGRHRPGRAPAAGRRRARQRRAPRAPDPARAGRHAARAPRRRRLHLGVTLVQAPARSSATCGWRSARRRRSAATSSPSAACSDVRGPNYRAAQGDDRGDARTASTVDDAASGEAHLPRRRRTMTEAAIDAGFTRDLYVSLGEPVGAALDRARLRQAVRRLDLGRLPDHGARRPARRHRPALPRRGARRSRGARPTRRRTRMKRLWFLIPLGGVPRARRSSSRVGLKLDPREVPSPLIDKPAPAFALPRLDDAGKTVRLEDMKGKVWILNVWASWCVACRDEHPVLVEFAKKRAVPIYGLNYKDTRDDAQRLAGALRQPVRRVALRRRRPRRHRLRRLRRARDLRHRQARRHPHQADRPADARGAGEQDRAAAEEARRLDAGVVASSSACCLAGGVAALLAKEAVPEAADPALEARMVAHHLGAALPGVPEPDHRRLERVAGGRPAPRGARAAASRARATPRSSTT